jgi:deoxycytidylate deaminase
VVDDSWPLDRTAKLHILKDSQGDTHILDGVPEPFESSSGNTVTFESLGEVTKYDVITHAEVNAIASAERSLIGCRLYCTSLPCAECVKVILTSGIKEIIYSDENPRFVKSYVVAKEMLDQAKVTYRQVTLKN